MKSMVRQLIAVTFGLCLSMLFSIFSFASTGYPWFKVPNNNTPYSVFIYWFDSNTTRYEASGTISSGGVVYIAKPSNFDSTYSSQYGVRVNFRMRDKGSGYYGLTFGNSNVTFIDNDPGANISPICWASRGYYSNTDIYSLQSGYVTSSGVKRFGQIMMMHPNGVDGGSNITASDFPITFKVSGYTGEFNYSGIPDDGVYNTTTINSNKSNTAIELTGQLSEDVEILSDHVNTMESDLTSIGNNIYDEIRWIAYNLTTLRASQDLGTSWNGHTLSTYYNRSYYIQDQHVIYTQVQKSGTFLGILLHKFNNILDYFEKQSEIYFQWFYPLKDATPQYWHVYNTDTDSTDVVNPATVTYYITWYLGQLFLMNNDNTPLGNLQDSVDDIKDQLVNVENQEQSIITSIRNGIDNFNPDLSQIGSFRALSWCSNYLQQIYVSLGTYGTVILIGLLLGVCMQFIGYFRYK